MGVSAPKVVGCAVLMGAGALFHTGAMGVLGCVAGIGAIGWGVTGGCSGAASGVAAVDGVLVC